MRKKTFYLGFQVCAKAHSTSNRACRQGWGRLADCGKGLLAKKEEKENKGMLEVEELEIWWGKAALKCRQVIQDFFPKWLSSDVSEFIKKIFYWKMLFKYFGVSIMSLKFKECKLYFSQVRLFFSFKNEIVVSTNPINKFDEIEI